MKNIFKIFMQKNYQMCYVQLSLKSSIMTNHQILIHVRKVRFTIKHRKKKIFDLRLNIIKKTHRYVIDWKI